MRNVNKSKFLQKDKNLKTQTQKYKTFLKKLYY